MMSGFLKKVWVFVCFQNKVGKSDFFFSVLIFRLEKEILDRYLDVVLKGNKDGLKVNLIVYPV
jgi:hypothetical protein